MLEAQAPWIVSTPIGPLLMTPATPTYADAVKALGATNLWRLGESSGNALDTIGSTTLTVSGSPTRGVTGAIDNDTNDATTFNGTNQKFANTGDAVFYENYPWSISAWVYPGTLTAATNHGTVELGDPTGGTLPYVTLYVDGDTYYPGIVVSMYGNKFTTEATEAINIGSWSHVCITWDGTQARIYLRGVLVETATTVQTPTALASQLTDGVSIGKGDGGWFPGSIDEVAVFSKTLTDAEVMSLAALGTELGDGYRLVLEEAPSTGLSSRKDVDEYPLADGGTVSDAYTDTRVVTFTGKIIASTAAGLQIGKQRVRGRMNRLLRHDGSVCWAPTAGFNPVTVPTVRRHEAADTAGGSALMTRFQFSTISGDPRVYEITPYVTEMDASTIGGVYEYSATGITSPVAESSTSTTTTVINSGDADSPGLWRLQGPFSAFQLVNYTTGEALTVDGFTIEADEYVTVDTFANEIYVGDTLTSDSDRYGYVLAGSTMWAFAPGDNYVRFIAYDTGSTTSALVRVQSAWLP